MMTVSWRGLALACAKLYAISGLGLAIALLLFCETWPGRLATLAVMQLGLLPLAGAYWAVGKRKSERVWPTLVCVVIFGVCISFLALNTPAGRPRAGARVSNRFAGGDWPFARYSIANLVPEIEQIKLGLALAAQTDPYIDAAQGRRVVDITLPIYHALERDPDFRQLGSVMGWTYAELWGGKFDYGHYYLYLPETTPGEGVPALVFLHGSAGNFKAYLWLMSRLGAARQMAIICPSFGSGNWYNTGGVEAIEAVVSHALDTLPIDPTRVYLAGISNGGTGASRAAAAKPDWYHGLIFISPVVEKKIITRQDFVRGWRGRPVLIIHGDQDRRIPAKYVRDRVADLVSIGADVVYQQFPGEDHFLLFSQPDAVLQALQSWLDTLN